MSVQHKRIGIHQPNYLPWIGYFIKINLSDAFVFHDNVEHSKSSLTRRTYIRKHFAEPESSRYLRIPLIKHNDFTVIKDLRISDSDWLQANINLLSEIYTKAPFYDSVMPILRELFEHSNEHFSFYSAQLNRAIADLLNLDTEFFFSSELKSVGSAETYNLNLVQELNGQVYVSGVGARKYQNDDLFESAGVKIQYVDPIPYLKSLSLSEVNYTYSILEFLLFYGLERTEHIIKNYKL